MIKTGNIHLAVALWLYAFVDVLRGSFAKNDKLVWLSVVVCLQVVGALLFLFIGKKRKLQLD
ncbi:PLD nuclease N-terminal domain-containing protein [Mangrovimonas sp. TPBH4]|uniref:PLD nuclease N-terminal domain-containing protein n=1 Tax=Mangrovimonas sp. TPBH4 TaxID=1645914 RepID=UPI0009E9858C